MSRLPRITGTDLVRALLRGGFFVSRQRGSHVRLRHRERPEVAVTVPVHAGRVLKPKTVESILEQAGWTVEDLRRYL